MATMRDRGQLLLIGGLSLAISLILIAVVLNSAIYTHNLASRYDSAADETVKFNHNLREGAGEQMESANEEYADNGYGSVGKEGTIVDAYVSSILDIENTTANANAIDGRIAQVSHDPGSDVEGVRIVDAEPGGSTFEPAIVSGLDTSNKSTVASEVRVRRFRMNVESVLASESLSDIKAFLDGSLLSDATNPTFAVVFDDRMNVWEVAVYQDSSSGDPMVMIHEKGTGVYQTCHASSLPAEINFANARFGGNACAPLSFIDDLDGTYEVRYYYGDMITGSYDLVADLPIDGPGSEVGPFTDIVDTANYGNHCGNSGAGGNYTYYNATSSNYPRISPALYAATIQTTYESDQVFYQGTQRVAPDEPGPVPKAPRITSFNVTESVDGNSTDKTYNVSWSVTDPNGDLDSITVKASDGSNNQTIDSQGSVTLTSLGLGPYTFNITATDGSNSRTVIQTHHDDGGESGCPE